MSSNEDYQYICSKGLHLWSKKSDARKCCKGWIRIAAPWFYRCKHVPRSCWYKPGSPVIYSLALVREDDLMELFRLRQVVPETLQASLDQEDLHLH